MWCIGIRSPISPASSGKNEIQFSSTVGVLPFAMLPLFAGLRISPYPEPSQRSRVARQSAGLFRTTPVRVVFLTVVVALFVATNYDFDC